MTPLTQVQARRCPICKSTVNWGKKVGRCKCGGKNWHKVVLNKDAAAK